MVAFSSEKLGGTCIQLLCNNQLYFHYGKHIYTWDGGQYICTLLLPATEQLTQAYKCHCSKAPSQLLKSICFYSLSSHRFTNRLDKINQSTLWSQAHFCNLQDTVTHFTNSSYFWICSHICVNVTLQLGSLIAVDGAAVTHADSSLSICHCEANTGLLTLQPQARH